MVSLARKEFGFVAFFHLIGILGEGPFVSKLRKAKSAQHSVPHNHWDNNAAERWVGAAFSGSFLSLKLVPSKRRCLVPGAGRDGAQSRPPALIGVLRNG